MGGLSGIGETRHVYAGAGETITLSGTSGSPNLSTDNESTPTNALAGWRFQADGDVERVVTDVWTQFNAGTEWTDSADPGDYWIRATLNAGDAPTSGPALNTWHVLSGTGETANREWTWLENSDPPAEATTAGTLQIDIATDSGGTNIVATGYYRGSATQTGTA